MAASGVDHGSVLRDPGCYEERYRLTGGALTLAASLLSSGLGVLWHMPVIFAVIEIILAALAARAHGMLGAVRRMIAFRADHAGITLAAAPGRLTSRHGVAVFAPWANVEQITLYPDPRGLGKLARFQCIGIQYRDGPPRCPTATDRIRTARRRAPQPARTGG